jgi:hypothetical protein
MVMSFYHYISSADNNIIAPHQTFEAIMTFIAIIVVLLGVAAVAYQDLT